MKILVLGREEDSLDYLRYCETHGIEATFVEPPSLAGIDRDAWQETLPALVAETVELDSFDEIVSFRDGYQVHTDVLRRHRGWPVRDIDAVNCLTDKSLFKSHPAVREFVAQHIEIAQTTDPREALAQVEATLGFPVVLKPSNGFYSAGVVRVDRPEDFRKAFLSVRRVCGLLRDSRGPSQIIAERYLDGDEVMVDGFVVDGKVTCLLFHIKLPRLTGLPSFHETGCVTQPFDGVKGPEFQEMLERVIGGVGLDNSAFNAEFRYDGDGRLHILECAPRISGGGASVQNLLRICTGLDAYGIQHRLGREPVDLTPIRHSAALEYDFCAAKNGHLVRLEDTVALLEDLSADTILRYRENGQFVFAPPLNVETVLTAYFACETAQSAEELLDVVQHKCVIETTDQPPA
ncbi:ATP-grasp domain-containing protein [Streptomyces sp. NPDC002285]